MSVYSSFLAEDTCAIFLFHGVIRKQKRALRNYTRKHIEATRFREILQDLLGHGTPIPLSLFVQASTRAALPPRSFAITFDDGFENNASVAAPILRELHVPATFYVTSGFVDDNSMSWIDIIEEAFERVATVDLAPPFSSDRMRCTTVDEKRQALDRIRARVKGDSSIDPYAFAQALLRQLGLPDVPLDLDLDQKMSWPQVADLSRDALFEVGGHGHTHRILSHLNQVDLEHEVGTSVDKLSAATGKPVRHFSYPEGLADCYSTAVVDVLRRRGVICSPTAIEGVNHVGDDPFSLKRIMVAD